MNENNGSNDNERKSIQKLLYEKPEQGKMYLEERERLANQILFISTGIFAVFPAVFKILRSPFDFTWTIWLIIASGVIAIICGVWVRVELHHLYNTYYLNKNKDEYENYKFSWFFWDALGCGGSTMVLQVAFFIFFIATNLMGSFHEAPEIKALNANKWIVEPGEEAIIQADVIDRDDDILSYSWKTNGGSILNNDEQVISWKAPADTSLNQKSYLIVVKVSDGHAEVTDTVEILVRESRMRIQRIEYICSMIKSITPEDSTDYMCSSFKKDIYDGTTPEERDAMLDRTESIVESEFKTASVEQKNKSLRCCSRRPIWVRGPCDKTC